MMKFTKRITSLLLVAVLLIGCMSAMASAAGEAYTLDNGVLTVNTMESYTGQDAPWYDQRESITSVVIASGVTKIGSFAFLGCVNLKDVTIPASVTTIESSAFYGCSNLTAIDLSNVTAMGSHAFHGAGLTDVILNPGLKSLEAGVFYQCNLNQIVFNGAYMPIAGDAFTDVTATAFYPADDASWTTEVQQNYGGSITWNPKGSAVGAFDGGKHVNTYYSLQYAADHYDATQEFLMLSDDLENAEVSLTQDLYINLAGHDLSGKIVTNGYQVYGIDTTTDRYTCENVSYFDVEDENGNPVEPVKHFKTEVTGAVRRYYAVETDGKWSFHRIYLGITSVVLRPGATGFGYKAIFGADEMVLADLDQEAAFGYGLWLGEGTAARKQIFKSKDEFVTGQGKTLLLKNIDIANYGSTAIGAEVYLKTKDGEVIDSADYSYTMKEMVESVAQSANWPSYTADQKSAMVDMYLRNAAAMELWNIASIKEMAETAE